jgi:hypothetical protein
MSFENHLFRHNPRIVQFQLQDAFEKGILKPGTTLKDPEICKPPRVFTNNTVRALKYCFFLFPGVSKIDILRRKG